MNLDAAASVLGDLAAGRRPETAELPDAMRILEAVESRIDSALRRDLRDVAAVIRKFAAGNLPILDRVCCSQALELLNAIEKLDFPGEPAFERRPERQTRPNLVQTSLATARQPEDASYAGLLNPTVQWIRSLPDGVRPLKIARGYPRIANLLAGAWLHPHEFEAKLDDFIFTDRQQRKGFPAEVAKELLNLKEHFRRNVNHVRTDVWKVNNLD